MILHNGFQSFYKVPFKNGLYYDHSKNIIILDLLALLENVDLTSLG